VPAIAASVRPSTLTRYQLDVDTLSRELGPVALQRLTGAQLDALYARRREGRLSGLCAPPPRRRAAGATGQWLSALGLLSYVGIAAGLILIVVALI
jgi:hypothetical protein